MVDGKPVGHVQKGPSRLDSLRKVKRPTLALTQTSMIHIIVQISCENFAATEGCSVCWHGTAYRLAHKSYVGSTRRPLLPTDPLYKSLLARFYHDSPLHRHLGLAYSHPKELHTVWLP